MPELEKRKAERQIAKDDCNNDDDDSNDVVTLGIPRADAETLKNRRMVKAKRTANGQLDLSKKSNAFASVELTANDDKKETPAAAGIFGQTTRFSGFKSTAATTGFAFGSSFSGSSGFGSAATEKDSTNGGGTAPAPFSGFGGIKPSTSGFTFGTKAPSSGFGTATSKDNAAQDDDASGGENPETAAPVESTTTPVVQLPENFEVVSGEEGEVELFKGRCKAYRWGPVQQNAPDTTATAEAAHPSVPPSKSGFEKTEATSPTVTDNDEKDESTSAENSNEPTEKWHEMGVGPLKILTNHQTGSARLVQRRESTPGVQPRRSYSMPDLPP